jgi:hypothetical protein
VFAASVSRVVDVYGQKRAVLLGDTVWWFAGNDTTAKPHVATLVGFSEDDQVDLQVQAHTEQPRIVKKTGVCLVGDPKLQNANQSSRGSWMPRWRPEDIHRG